jgi:hypothetical protein
MNEKALCCGRLEYDFPVLRRTMNPVIGAIVLLACLPALGQAAADKFVGTWDAAIDGEPFVTLILQKKGDDIGGTIVQNDFDLSEDGEITNIQPTHKKSRILSAELSGKRLKITSQNTKQGDKVRYILDPPEDGETKIFLLVGGYDAPKIAPLTLKKQPGK